MKILIIMQRSNGDVFLTSPLIRKLYEYYDKPTIDMLVNDDTLAIAKTLPYINDFVIFSYAKKKNSLISMLKQEYEIILKIWRKYDLSINLTASDRSVQYAIMASKNSISAIESESCKSWWKKLFLNKDYLFSSKKHAIFNMIEPLKLLRIEDISYDYSLAINSDIVENVLKKFDLYSKDYIVFHPSAQYIFRTYPIDQINELILLLKELGLKIVVTGSNDEINKEISKYLIIDKDVLNLISKTSLEELFVLIANCKVHIGMDTLNTHIAASYNVDLIAIYGPNGVSQWSPFNSILKYSPPIDTPPITKYGNFTILQANMPCVPCNKKGCNGSGKSECLYQISPTDIFKEVASCLIKLQ